MCSLGAGGFFFFFLFGSLSSNFFAGPTAEVKQLATMIGARPVLPFGPYKSQFVIPCAKRAELPHLNITDDPRIAKAATELKDKLSNITPDKIKNSLGERERIVADTKSILDNLGGVYG